MKQTNLLKTFLLLCAMVVGGSAWADESSYTITFKDTGTSSDGSTAWSTSSDVSDVLTEGGDYVSSISAASRVYPARNGRGAKFGAASNAGSITFDLSNDGKVKATKVIIKGGAYIASNKAEKAAVKVNNGTAVEFDQTVTTYTEEEITYNFPTATDITSLTLTQATASKGRFYIVSVTVYYEEDAAGGETATWTLNPTSASVMAGQSTTLQLTTNYDGTLNFSSNDTGVATVSYNSSTKVITVTGVAAGTTTISATGDATATYKAVSKSINVTVSHAELESNVTDVMSGFGYTYFGYTTEGDYAQPDVTSTDKTDSYGVTISFARAGSSNTKVRFDENCVRFYKGNTLTVTAPTGSYLTKIVFTEPSSKKGWDGSMTASSGEYINVEKTWYATSTGVTSLVLTETDATNRIGGMKVYLNVSSVPVSISAAGLATFAYDVALDFTSVENLEAYIATTDGSTIALAKKNIIPANTGVLLRALNDATDFNVPVTTAAADDVTGNLFVRGTGAAVESGSDPYNYVLAKHGSDIGFYKANGIVVATNKAYLQTAIATARIDVNFGETTAIETVKSEKVYNEYYNLAGQRVAQPTKGLYIVNGRKVVVK